MLHLGMKNLLKSKKLRVTSFRTDVLNVFQSHENAIDMGMVENELGEHDRITLYRTIKKFIDVGILHEILINGESKKYALCSHSCESEAHHHDHIHFLCTDCNETYCLEPQQMPVINHPSFQIDSFEVQAKGICDNCKS
jgi:Fur family transcriptional regulator, ferric uptake regulator